MNRRKLKPKSRYKHQSQSPVTPRDKVPYMKNQLSKPSTREKTIPPGRPSTNQWGAVARATMHGSKRPTCIALHGDVAREGLDHPGTVQQYNMRKMEK